MGRTVTSVFASVEVHPLVVPLTVKVAFASGVTSILMLVAPLLQRKFSAPVAVKVAVSPAQILALFTEITGMGRTVTSALTRVEVHPLVVPLTVRVAFASGETSMLGVVVPLLQRKFSAPVAVKVAVSPTQILALFTEISGIGRTVTSVLTRVEVHPLVVPLTV